MVEMFDVREGQEGFVMVCRRISRISKFEPESDVLRVMYRTAAMQDSPDKTINRLDDLFENNRRWVAQTTAKDPDFFRRLSSQQTPKYLWIGCSDSRVPANEIVGLLPGELFVHRNISNVVALDDPNCLSVIQYAVDVLQVRHIIVCGHFGCGGVEAALEDRKLGLSDKWLKHVRQVRDKHEEQLRGLNKIDRFNRLCELNVVAQVFNVARTDILNNAWSRQQGISVHGWIYAIENGLLRDLDISITGPGAASR